MRIVLVQPDVTECDALAERLVAIGHDVVMATEDAADALSAATHGRLTVVLSCLDVAPDRALVIVRELVADRHLRGVPLLFVGGTADALTAAETEFPRASFTRVEQLITAVATMRL